MRRGELGAGLAAALVAGALFFGHGSSDGRLFWIGAAALLLAAIGWILRPAASGVPGAAFLVLLGLFVVWQAISIHWSIQPARSWDYSNRGLVYFAFAAVGALLGGFAAPPNPGGVCAFVGGVF